MAFPTVSSRTGYVSPASNSTSWAAFSGVSVPNNALALFFTGSDGAVTLSETGGNGWTKEGQANRSGLAPTAAVFSYKNTTGSTQNKSFTLGSSASEQFSGILVILTGGNLQLAVNGSNSASGTNPNPAAVSPGAGTQDLTIIAFVAVDGTVVASAAPTNYGNLTTRAASGTAGSATYIADRDINASSEDPGAFTSASSAWVSYTLAVWDTGGGTPSLSPADADHAHTADAVTVSAKSTLAPQDADHGHTADNATVSLSTTLLPADADHGHTADGLSITAKSALSPIDADHGHTADALTITAKSSIAPSDADHGHSADNATISAQSTITPAEAEHAHTADILAITAKSIILPGDAEHGHEADSLTIAAAGNLAPADADHDHQADDLLISFVGNFSLYPDDADHGHEADEFSIIYREAPVPPLIIGRWTKVPAQQGQFVGAGAPAASAWTKTNPSSPQFVPGSPASAAGWTKKQPGSNAWN